MGVGGRYFRYWDGKVTRETDEEMAKLRERRDGIRQTNAPQKRVRPLSKRQQRTTAQAASDAAERAECVMRRANRGWLAPGIRGTPLEAWHASCWGEWEKDLDALISKAETYSVSRTMDEHERATMMARLKAKTCTTEKLVGVQRSALARRRGVEDVWHRWVASNGWAERAA